MGRDENYYPWVVVDEEGLNTCPLGSINPGHWKHSNPNGRCRCYDDIYIFNWDK